MRSPCVGISLHNDVISTTNLRILLEERHVMLLHGAVEIIDDGPLYTAVQDATESATILTASS